MPVSPYVPLLSGVDNKFCVLVFCRVFCCLNPALLCLILPDSYYRGIEGEALRKGAYSKVFGIK